MLTSTLAVVSRALTGLAVVAKKPSFFMTVLMSALAHFTYVALVGILVIAGTGLPIPEDIPLLFSGYLCNEQHSPIITLPGKMIDTDGDGVKDTEIPRHIPNLYIMIAAGMIGVLAGDSIVFSIGRRGIEADNFVARHLRKVMHSKRRERVERHFAQHGNLTVFVGRFMPGFRSIVFAFAGLSKMSYARFLLIDGVAAGVSVPVFIWLGYYFADRFEKLFEQIDRIKHILGPILIAAVVIGVIFYVVRKRRAQAPANPA